MTTTDGFKNRIQVWQEVLRNFNFVTQYFDCQKRNGTTEIIYGKYRFPFGYFHTILDHYIEVPIEFQQWVMNTPHYKNKGADSRGTMVTNTERFWRLCNS